MQLQSYILIWKKLQNYSFVIGFWRRLVITFALHKSFILCICTKSSYAARNYMKKEYHGFINGLEVI